MTGQDKDNDWTQKEHIKKDNLEKKYDSMERIKNVNAIRTFRTKPYYVEHFEKDREMMKRSK